MSALRVLTVLHDERVGGPQLRVMQVATLLKEQGLETIVAMPAGNPAYASMLINAGIESYEFDLVRLRESSDPQVHARYLRRFWPNVRTLRRLIRQRDIDVVHANGLIHLQAPIATRLEDVPLVWHLNDVGTPRPLRWAFLPLVRRWASVIAVSSHGVTEHYFGAEPPGADRFILLYPPVDCVRFNPSVSGEGVRNELGMTGETPVIGTMGSVNPGKGIHILLRAFLDIKRRHPGVKLLVVGERLETRRNYAQALSELTDALGLRDHVIFTGRRSDVPEVLAAMDVYVHAALVEAAGMATMEACASGLPVVVSRVGGAAEIVDNGNTGILVRPGSPRDLANAVSGILESPQSARDMGLRGAIRMRESFSLDKCADTHQRMYRMAIERHENLADTKSVSLRARVWK